MILLPPPAARAYLVRELTSLIHARGFAPFVSAPLLEPRVHHFPDPWRPDALGVERVARRLLTYAGLADLQVDIELFKGDVDVKKLNHDGTAGSWSHEGAAAWFAGIEDGRCRFGTDTAQLDTPDVLLGVMAHEVAHAFRHQHGLNLSRREVEEPLTDLTTIYLGFGVLTTNSSYRYRQSGELLGIQTRTQWSHQSLGYLTPQAMSFLLAVQAVVRGLPPGECRRIAGLLEANQAAFFKAALKVLDRDTLLATMKLPPSTEWPAVVNPSPIAFDTTDDPPLADRHQAALTAFSQRYQGLAVFRVGRDAAAGFTALGLAVGAGLGIWLALGLSNIAGLVAFAAVTVVARRSGKRRRHDRCSEPDCHAVIPPEATQCPGCAGTVSGRINHEDDRLEAREALEGPDDVPDAADDDDGDEDGEDRLSGPPPSA